MVGAWWGKQGQLQRCGVHGSRRLHYLFILFIFSPNQYTMQRWTGACLLRWLGPLSLIPPGRPLQHADSGCASHNIICIYRLDQERPRHTWLSNSPGSANTSLSTVSVSRRVPPSHATETSNRSKPVHLGADPRKRQERRKKKILSSKKKRKQKVPRFPLDEDPAPCCHLTSSSLSLSRPAEPADGIAEH